MFGGVFTLQFLRLRPVTLSVFASVSAPAYAMHDVATSNGMALAHVWLESAAGTDAWLQLAAQPGLQCPSYLLLHLGDTGSKTRDERLAGKTENCPVPRRENEEANDRTEHACNHHPHLHSRSG